MNKDNTHVKGESAPFSVKTRKRRGASSSAAANTVVFDPLVGCKYEEHGRECLGRHVMIVGASHYCKEHYSKENGCSRKCSHYGKHYVCIVGTMEPLYFGRGCKAFTESIYKCYRGRLKVQDETGEKCSSGWMGTFSRFYNSFFGDGNPSVATRNKLLDHLVCTEYMQGVESGSPDEHNDEMMGGKRNYEEFVKQVERLKPDVVIVWGPRVWKSLCKWTGTDYQDMPFDKKTMLLGGHQAEVVRIPHPASRRGNSRFDREDFQNLLKSEHVKLLSVKG